jgi:hypothetical protein
MAVDEGMAVSFYKIGDASGLADQLVEILQSPERQRSMAETNYAAGVAMTMESVVSNYLRWFELNKRKKETRQVGFSPERRLLRLRSLFSRGGGTLPPDFLAQRVDGHHIKPAGLDTPPIDLGNSVAWSKSEASKNSSGW